MTRRKNRRRDIAGSEKHQRAIAAASGSVTLAMANHHMRNDKRNSRDSGANAAGVNICNKRETLNQRQQKNWRRVSAANHVRRCALARSGARHIARVTP